MDDGRVAGCTALFPFAVAMHFRILVFMEDRGSCILKNKLEISFFVSNDPRVVNFDYYDYRYYANRYKKFTSLRNAPNNFTYLFVTMCARSILSFSGEEVRGMSKSSKREKRENGPHGNYRRPRRSTRLPVMSETQK